MENYDILCVLINCATEQTGGKFKMNVCVCAINVNIKMDNFSHISRATKSPHTNSSFWNTSSVSARKETFTFISNVPVTSQPTRWRSIDYSTSDTFYVCMRLRTKLVLHIKCNSLQILIRITFAVRRF